MRVFYTFWQVAELAAGYRYTTQRKAILTNHTMRWLYGLSLGYGYMYRQRLCILDEGKHIWIVRIAVYSYCKFIRILQISFEIIDAIFITLLHKG